MGSTLVQVCADTPAKVEAFRKEMQPLRQTLKTNQFLGGSKPNYADIAVAGNFLVRGWLWPFVLLRLLWALHAVASHPACAECYRASDALCRSHAELVTIVWLVCCQMLVHSYYAGSDVLVHCSDANVVWYSGHGPSAKCSCWPRMTQFMSGVSACSRSLMAQSGTASATLSRHF